MTTIRPALPADLPGAYRVCLLTGDAGRDGTALFRNLDLLGHLYVGPYVVGCPDLALVVVDPDGVAGYCLAAPDTRAFEAWCDRSWFPVLREQYPPTEEASPDGELIRLIHAPAAAPDAVVAAYPAQLHIDLLERARGLGVGRALVERNLARLRELGARGLHLDVATTNANAIAFYEHLGFHALEIRGDSLFMGLVLA